MITEYNALTGEVTRRDDSGGKSTDGIYAGRRKYGSSS